VIALVRHGQSTSNAQGLVVGRGDPHLTQLGERQARALAPWLENATEVWTSPLLRARETAALAMPELVALVRDSFVELDYGSFEGALATTAPGEGWRALELRHDQAFGGGESLAELDERVHHELDALLGDPTSLLYSPSEHLAIVSHVSPIKSAVAWALGVPGTVAWRMRLENGSLTLVGARNGTPRLIRYNAVPTLA
jgi:alpha-ribazole phosphatase